MSPNPSQANDLREAFEAPKSPSLRLVHGGGQTAQTRRRIGDIANESYREGLISEEAYKGYMKLAEETDGEMDAQMLEKTCKFAEKHGKGALPIHQKIQTAISQKIASKTDEDHLMNKYVFENFKFAEQAEAVEAMIDVKIDNMKREKARYTALANHKLIKGNSYLIVDGSVRIIFPDEKGFLKLTVPQRRELLKKLEEAMPKAEKYAEECEDKEDEKLIIGYEKKLDEARKEGIIGEHTYKEFLNGFKKINHDEKECWDSEFESQMQRYRVLWTQIRSTLQGEALKGIEGMIDESGYTEIFAQFGKLKESESKRLTASYAGELEKYREAGTIGKHTMTQFVLWMNQQELSDKYEAEGKLEGEILRYEDLWQKSEELPKKDQDFMRSNIDVWGYTELNQQYLTFTGENASQEEADASDSNDLSQLRSAEVRDAIVETDEMLVGQGKGKRRTFIEVLDKMFNSNVGRESFDAHTFESKRRAEVANDNGVGQNTKSREAGADVNLEQIKEDAKILEGRGAKVTQQLGFIQVESEDKTGKRGRETQVTINEEEGVKRLFTEEGQHSYQSDKSGGNDDLSLAIKTGSNRTVELDLQEIHTLRHHLKKTEEQDKEA